MRRGLKAIHKRKKGDIRLRLGESLERPLLVCAGLALPFPPFREDNQRFLSECGEGVFRNSQDFKYKYCAKCGECEQKTEETGLCAIVLER
jgi:hypothetical protein